MRSLIEQYLRRSCSCNNEGGNLGSTAFTNNRNVGQKTAKENNCSDKICGNNGFVQGQLSLSSDMLCRLKFWRK